MRLFARIDGEVNRLDRPFMFILPFDGAYALTQIVVMRGTFDVQRVLSATADNQSVLSGTADNQQILSASFDAVTL